MKKLKDRKINLILNMVLTGFIIISFCQVNLEAAPGLKKELKSPMRIAFGPANNLIVSDYSSGFIYTIDRNRNTILKGFKINGKPLGVDYLKGKYFVGNRTTRKIEVYTGSGKISYSFSGVLKQPNDIVIDGDGEKLYAVDTLTGRMLIYTIEGQLIKSVSDNLTAPTGIALDEINGLVYVSDYGDPGNWTYPSIQIFSLEGEYTGKISGKLGMFGNRFSRPQGLAIGNNGYVFMVDCYSSEIMVFNGPGGIFIKTISGYGDAPGRMRLPIDIVINNKTKDIFVTNNRARTIEIFRKGGQLK